MISGLKFCGATGALYDSVQPRADQYFPHTNLIFWAAGLKARSWLWMSFFFLFRSLFVSRRHSLLSFCLSMTPYLSFHLYSFPPFVSLSAALSSQRALHLSVRVIEPCVLSLSAKRLADRLHFHAEGCEDSVAVVRVIDWDPSKPPPLGSYYCLSSCLVAALILSAWTRSDTLFSQIPQNFAFQFTVL